MARLGFMTYGILKAGFGDPSVQGFVDRIANIFDVAKEPEDLSIVRGQVGLTGAPGFPPRFSDGFEKRTVGRLSIWEDIDAVSIFALQGVHSEALHKRPEWFEPSEHPDHVGWRIDEDHIPTWAEACERL
ncbi:TPA: hypothetical protein DCE37_04760 [Candidatus Latescibacteria bacterium]|nr:hypothetical protein [Candidatus Latescibacterota bacterium]|tara:strand:+ start:522 stop:911 length:390 start_codon:yes stop_codon:yes gene_type:complete